MKPFLGRDTLSWKNNLRIIKATEDSFFSFTSRDGGRVVSIYIDGNYEVDDYDIKVNSQHGLEGNKYYEQVSSIEGRIDFYETFDDEDGDVISHEFKIDGKEIEANYKVELTEIGQNAVFVLEMGIDTVDLDFRVEGKSLILKSASVGFTAEN